MPARNRSSVPRPNQCIGITTRAFSRCHHPDHRGGVEGDAAVDRRHHHVEPADRRELRLVGLVVEVAEMADAEAGDLEDEDRVAVLAHPVEAAADVGRHVAHPHLAEVESCSRRSPPCCGQPSSTCAIAGSGTWVKWVMWALFIVTTSGTRSAPPSVVGEIGHRRDPARGLDQEAGVVDIGDPHRVRRHRIARTRRDAGSAPPRIAPASAMQCDGIRSCAAAGTARQEKREDRSDHRQAPVADRQPTTSWPARAVTPA